MHENHGINGNEEPLALENPKVQFAGGRRFYTFSTEHLQIGLGRRCARGGVAALLGRLGRFATQLAGLAIISRLLTPNDFGLVNMVAVITGLMTMFGDLGLSAAVIQRPEVNHRQMSTLFWLSVCLGSAIALITAALGPVVVWFYDDLRLLKITVALGMGFLIAGLGIQHQALLKRKMDFGVLAGIDVASGFVGALAGIAFAAFHFGYWSLIMMQLAASASTVGLSWIFCPWRPSLPSRSSGIRSIVVFGRNLTVFNFLNYVVRNLDNVLIGWRWGATELGFYSRAYQLMLLPLSQIIGPVGTVAIPALSRLQNDEERYRDYYLRCLKMIAYVSMPLLVVMGVLADEIIYFVLGSQWHAASTLFRILALAAIFQPVVSSSGWILTSLNRTKTMALWGVITCPVMVVAFSVGLWWGAVGVACGYAIADWLLSWPALVVATRTSPIRLRDIGLVIYRPFILSIVLGATLLLCEISFVSLGYYWLLILAPLVCTSVFLVLWAAWKALRSDLREIADNLRMIARPPNSKSA